jgi:hypothetical protein
MTDEFTRHGDASMTPPASPENDPLHPHATLAVLPGGAVHADGLLRSGPGTTQDLIEQALMPWREHARQTNQPVRLTTGHPDGSVQFHLLDTDGTAHPVAGHPAVPPLDAPDPRWTDGMPEHRLLVETVRAADRKQQWAAARIAAGRLTAHLETTVGEHHPHTVLARELQGIFALRSRDWTAAAQLLVRAAAGRYAQQAPAADTDQALDRAVGTWMRARSDPAVRSAGYDFAHLLLKAAPDRPGPIAAMLRSLGPELSS